MNGRFLALSLLLCLIAAGAQAQPAEPKYEDLMATYEYDHAMSLAAEWDDELKADGRPIRVTFEGVGEERIPALVGLPSEDTYGSGPYPAVVFGHGLGGSKDDATYKGALMILLQSGFAGIMIDYPHHGERATGDLAELESLDLANTSPERVASLLKEITSGTTQTVLDQMRAIDLLLSIDDIDPERIGYAGLSLGAILGTVLSGADDRLACTALIVGGADWSAILSGSQLTATVRDTDEFDPEAVGAELTAADPKYFAPHIDMPALLIFGGQDDIVPYEPAGKLLSELVPEPKKVVVFEESGHTLDANGDQFMAIMELTAFLTEHLSPGEE